MKKKQQMGRCGLFRQEDTQRWSCASMNLHNEAAAQQLLVKTGKVLCSFYFDTVFQYELRTAKTMKV